MSDNQMMDNTNLDNSIRLVVQRYRKASLLIDEKEVVTVGGCPTVTASLHPLLGGANKNRENKGQNENGGANTNNDCDHIGMLVYVSFSKRARPQDVQKAARTILNLPIQTEGAWGDGSTTKSIVQSAVEAETKKLSVGKDDKEKQSNSNSNSDPSPAARVSILLVPQANLIAKVKKNGKSVQYRDQIDKKNGEALYNMFVESIESMLVEEQQQIIRRRTITNQPGGGPITNGSGNPTSAESNNKCKASSPFVNPSVPPEKFFECLMAQQEEPMYGSLDSSTGLPLTASDGGPLTKSASKRIKKLYDVHAKKHEKYKSKRKKEQEEKQQQQQQDSPAEGSSTFTDPIESGKSTNKRPENTTPSGDAPKDTDDVAAADQQRTRLDPSFVKLVAGSFGKRQGLELISDMGPFCHVIDL